MNQNREIVDGVLLTAEDQLDGDTAEELASFIDDMNSTENADAYITVLRIPTDSRGTPLPNSKHAGQLFHELLGRSTVNDVIERIRAGYIQPGQNSITVRIMGKRPGERKLLFNRIYTIERPVTPEKKGDGSLGEMLALIQQNAEAQAQRTENFMREMLAMQANARIAAPVDPIDQMTKLMTAFAPVMAAVAGRPMLPAPTGGGASEMLATVKVLKEASNLFGGGGNDDSGSTMSTVKAVAEAVGPGLKFLAARAETERLSVQERLSRLPAPVAQVAKAPPPTRPAPTPKPPNKAAPTARPASVAAAPIENNTEGEDVNLKEMRERLLVVAQLCDEGQDAKAVAELIVDNCEDDQLEELYRQAEPENFVSKMKVLCPSAIVGREEWFEKLRTEILAQYENDPDAVPAEGGDGSTAAELGADPVDTSSIPNVN